MLFVYYFDNISVEKQSLATIHVEPIGIAASVAAPHIIYLPLCPGNCAQTLLK
jgi:hypothetical protein